MVAGGLGDHPRGDGGLRARPRRDDQGLFELHPRPRARASRRRAPPPKFRVFSGHGPRLLAGVLPARRGRAAGRADPRQDRGARWRRARDPQPARLEPRDARAHRVRRPAAASATDAPHGRATCDRPASTRRSTALAERPRTLLAGGTDVYPARVGRPSWTTTSSTSPACRSCARSPSPTASAGSRPSPPGPTSSAPTCRRAFDGLKAAARAIGGVQIQNRGTVAGNLCNASPAADGLPNLMALDARVELASAAGSAGGAGRRVRRRQSPDGPPAGRARDGGPRARSRRRRPARRSSSSGRGPTSSSRSRWSPRWWTSGRTGACRSGADRGRGLLRGAAAGPGGRGAARRAGRSRRRSRSTDRGRRPGRPDADRRRPRDRRLPTRRRARRWSAARSRSCWRDRRRRPPRRRSGSTARTSPSTATRCGG